MKTKYYLKLTLLFLILSCGSDDSFIEEKKEDKNEEIENYKYLTQVRDYEDNNGVFSKSIDITYSDNNLMTIYNGDKGEFIIEYNTNKQISKLTSKWDDIQIFTYEKNKLSMITYDNSWHDSFVYENEKLKSILENLDDNYDESLYIYYEEDGSVKSYRIGSLGSVISFKFDNKNNPFYPLWGRYNFYQDLENEPYTIGGLFFKHNPTKVFEDNKLRLEASYSYDEEGYPIRCTYKKYNLSDGSVTKEGTINFKYKE